MHVVVGLSQVRRAADTINNKGTCIGLEDTIRISVDRRKDIISFGFPFQ